MDDISDKLRNRFELDQFNSCSLEDLLVFLADEYQGQSVGDLLERLIPEVNHPEFDCRFCLRRNVEFNGWDVYLVGTDNQPDRRDFRGCIYIDENGLRVEQRELNDEERYWEQLRGENLATMLSTVTPQVPRSREWPQSDGRHTAAFYSEFPGITVFVEMIRYDATSERYIIEITIEPEQGTEKKYYLPVTLDGHMAAFSEQGGDKMTEAWLGTILGQSLERYIRWVKSNNDGDFTKPARSLGQKGLYPRHISLTVRNELKDFARLPEPDTKIH